MLDTDPKEKNNIVKNIKNDPDSKMLNSVRS